MKTWALVWGLTLSGCIRPQGGADPARYSGIEAPAPSRLFEAMRALASEAPTLVRVDTYGEISGATAPLFAVRIADDTARRSLPQRVKAPAIFISDVTHGDEYIGVVDRLPRLFVEKAREEGAVRRFLQKGGVFYIVPVVNPVGVQSVERSNGRETDLNRAFPQGGNRDPAAVCPTAPEISFLLQKLNTLLAEDQTDLFLTMDYHCCSKDADAVTIIHPDFSALGLDSARTQSFAGTTSRFGEMANATFGRVKYGTTQQTLGYASQGTSKDCFFASYMLPEAKPGEFRMSFTMEGLEKKSGMTENPNRFDLHAALWERVVDAVAGR